MTNLYLDPNGKEITFKQWKKRIPAEYTIHEHTTDRSITKLVASDIVMDANLVPAPLHKRYRMESINILRHDAFGVAYDEPRYVSDDFAAKSFPTKEKAVKAYVDFVVTFGGAKRSDVEAILAKDVKATVAPAVTIPARGMELPMLSKPKPVAEPEPVEDDEGEDDFKHIAEMGGTKGDPEPEAELPPPKGSDAPKTVIADDIGSW